MSYPLQPERTLLPARNHRIGSLFSRILPALGALSTVFTVGSCASQPHLQYSQSPNFNQELAIFVNSDGSTRERGFFKVFELAWAFLTAPDDPVSAVDFPMVREEDRAKGNPSATWIGHATLLVETAGQAILTDPMFSDRASPISFLGPKRFVPPAITIKDLPPIDIIFVSHSHYDHLDIPSLEALALRFPDIVAIVPLGLGVYAREAGISDVRELDWWQSTEHNGAKITATPVNHWSSRSPFRFNTTLWAGFWLETDDLTFFFAADTGYSNDFTEVRNRLGSPDLAGIPIGGYEPRDFMRTAHVNPEESVKVFNDLNAGLAIGLHWGTFRLTTEPARDPPLALARVLRAHDLPSSRFRALRHGETWVVNDDLNALGQR